MYADVVTGVLTSEPSVSVTIPVKIGMELTCKKVWAISQSHSNSWRWLDFYRPAKSEFQCYCAETPCRRACQSWWKFRRRCVYPDAMYRRRDCNTRSRCYCKRQPKCLVRQVWRLSGTLYYFFNTVLIQVAHTRIGNVILDVWNSE
jgi:hypothetical protein